MPRFMIMWLGHNDITHSLGKDDELMSLRSKQPNMNNVTPLNFFISNFGWIPISKNALKKNIIW